MRRARYSIANLLAVIGVLAVAMAALRNPSYLWANVTFSLAFTCLAVAIINAVYGQGARRAYWFGFSVCGGAYFAVCSMPGLRESVCPRLATEVVFDHLYPIVAPPDAVPSQPTMNGMMGQMQAQMLVRLQTQLNGMTGTASQPSEFVPAGEPPGPASSSLEGRWAAWNATDRSNGVGYQIGTVLLVSSDPFRQIGHSLATLLLALLGGVYARGRYEAAQARNVPVPQPVDIARESRHDSSTIAVRGRS
jgi:hypothetical protein